MPETNNDLVTIRAEWFTRLKELADRFEKSPNESNKALLLGYISSVEELIKQLVVKDEE